MAHKKKGHLTVSGEWAKHLRKRKSNLFWKGERNAGKELVRTELIKGEESGLSNKSVAEILAEAKRRAPTNL
ncbi:hypothetical protein [Algoriphagus aquimarinus]|uniref:Uncharacterized protein n=1 Tax=Algoriphagus aquimarinus TaxID=237018 RepID=A0A1I0Y255_9BACT|nr:hypothetical protein [Algoriphagus aquimarinus]SFB06967.1 hypothetical protein SAMN04489723_10456 [Algoriphagus aquimarinus]